MKFGLPEEDIIEIKNEIFKNLGETINPKVYIYGSRVKGNYRKFSDIDLLLRADTFDEKSLSMIDFSNLITPFKVDFVLDKDLFEDYKKEIYSHYVEF